MFVRYSFVCRVLIKSFLSVLVFVTAGCGPLFGPVPPEEGSQCKHSSPEANPYEYAVTQMASQPSDASITYHKSFEDLVGARQWSLFQLGDNARNLSDRVDIATAERSMVRITVTYLDPELIQLVVLNHFLNEPNRITTPTSIEEFNREINDTLLKLSERNEMLFLITVTSPFYKEQAYNSDVVTVEIPINEMVLINGSSKRVNPIHADYALGANIDITHGPVSGIVGFPTAVINRGQCVLITDEWTTSLTLEIPRVTLGNTDVNSQYWSIPFRSLLMRDDNHAVPTYDPAFMTPVVKLESPPTPSWFPNAQEDPTKWEIYWDEMGRFIWDVMITESHR